MDQNDPSTKPTRAEALLARRALIERQLKAIAARQNTTRRKAEARAKFLLGGVVLTRAADEPALLEQCCAQLGPRERQHVRSVVAALRVRQSAA